MFLTKKVRLAAGIVLGAGVLITPLAAASSATAASNPDKLTKVAAGLDAADLPGASVFGNTPPSTPVTVSFILKLRDEASLGAAVERGIPTADYLRVGQFAAKYGQPASNIGALTSYLAGFGIKTSVYPDHLDVVANGTAGDFNSALSVKEKEVTVPAQASKGQFGPATRKQTVYTNTTDPLLPARLASFVTAVLGLSDYGSYVSDTAKPAAATKAQSGSSNTCVAEFGLTNGCHLPSDFAKLYDLDPLYRHADGSGQTVGIVTLAAIDPGPTGYAYAPDYFWDNIADVHRTGTLTVDNVDGGPGAASADSGSVETDLDIEQSGSLAPGANVIDYQAPNTDYGFADAFFTAASQDLASSVSASWGESETAVIASVDAGEESAGYAAAFDEVYLEFAAQGQSAFTSAGDYGAYTAAEDIGTTNLAVDQPGDSPYITVCGGTSLPGSTYLSGPDGTATATNPATRIWGWDYLWSGIASTNGVSLATVAESYPIGGGGGFSVLEPEPSYQKEVSGTSYFHAVEYLTPTDYETVAPGLVEPTEWTFNPTPGVTTGTGTGRVLPDLSTDADPQTGYLVYGASAGGVSEYGGTSFVAPQLNGATALIDSYLGHRVGFWNPVIYAAAADRDHVFTQLNTTSTSNDNIYYTGNPGAEFNEGDGLGQPNLAALASVFRASAAF